ncbi:MAG: protein translocase subunit SecF [Clostridia bacterium]|nr:protein translocase subunit SecF [Clostridia bacterium]
MTKAKKTKFSIDERISNSKFDFCKNLKWFLVAPLAIILVGVILLCTIGFNLGIDFTGGSNMTIFVDKEGTYSSQKYDVEKDLGVIENKINDVLKEHGLVVSTIQKTTMSDDILPITNGDAVMIKFQNDNSLTSAEITEINEQIRLELLVEFGFVPEGTTDVSELDNAGLVKNNDITTASASSELMMKSFIALLVAVVLILIYVAFRFEITSGLAAILALFHDLLVTASIMLIFRVQINVAFIAALITILGYSINNTIIIFDRMRERMKEVKNMGLKIDNNKIANESVKGTMMRSILTMVTTFIMIFMITVIGVADIREFAFPIMIGILAGFYSSVFMTPGLWAIAYRPSKRKKSSNKPSKKVNEGVVVEVEKPADAE